MKVADCGKQVVEKPQAGDYPPPGAWPGLQAGAAQSTSTHLEHTHLHGHHSIERDQQDHESNSCQDGGTQVLRRHGEWISQITRVYRQNPTDRGLLNCNVRMGAEQKMVSAKQTDSKRQAYG